ncbi:hypothetical protein [Leifsonia aquatica]|uniref:hypothetical protein n=1 Tax=Leifsonia aquatica TaxID=144185 RepID=UPI0013B3CDB6|nr:hypothetical protein [Leifsonia aquatica]
MRNEADREFQQAHEESVDLKCRKPGAWRYYIGFKPSQRPTAEGAKRLCAGVAGVSESCPLLEACRAFAHNLPPGVADGVWGGQVWIDGVLQAE